MNKRRLLKLADLLEADAKNKKGIKFDLHRWGRVANPEDAVSCNTQACAVGLAAVSGVFKRSGLSYRLGPQSLGGREILVTLDGLCRPSGEFDGSFMSATKFFDLSPAEGAWLFVPNSYPDEPTTEAEGERVVAKRIRNFVAGKATPHAL